MKLFLALLIMELGASAAFGEIYTWKDKKGTVFYTNSLHEIPARYLDKARVLDVATGKKGGPATAQPGTPTAPAYAGQAPSSHSPPTAAQAPVPAPSLPAPAAPAPAPAPGAAPTATPPAAAVGDPDAELAPAATASRPRQREVTGQPRRSSRRRSSTGDE